MADPRDGFGDVGRDPIPPGRSKPPTTAAVCALEQKTLAIDVVDVLGNLPPEVVSFVDKLV